MLGFGAIAQFDLAFGAMVVGALLSLPVNIVTALYRARGLYGRAVKFANLGMLGALLGQFAAVTLTQSLFWVAIVFVATQMLTAAYLLTFDAPRLFPFLRGMRASVHRRWIAGQFRTRFRSRWQAAPISHCSICRYCW